jgi:hypothetical protein
MQGVKQESDVEDPRTAELQEYRALSASALVGLFLSFLSLAAFAHPVLWSLPVVAALVNLGALARMRSQAPRLVGRGVALTGLALSLMIGAAASSQYLVTEARIRYEMRQMAQLWFDAVRHRQYEPALELLLEPWKRQPPGEDLQVYYRDDPRASEAKLAFANGELVRAIAAVGEDAQIRCVETQVHHLNQFKERIGSIWAVTYQEDGKTKSFLVRVGMERDRKGLLYMYLWWITKVQFVDDPPAWLRAG